MSRRGAAIDYVMQTGQRPSERMGNACRSSLITSASTDNRPTMVHSCLPASMRGVLAFSVSYIAIHAKLVILLPKIGIRCTAYHD